MTIKTHVDVPNVLVSAIGMLNGACNKANVSWQILKYPEENKYTALLTPVRSSPDTEWSAVVVEAEYIDDLIMRMVEATWNFE